MSNPYNFERNSEPYFVNIPDIEYRTLEVLMATSEIKTDCKDEVLELPFHVTTP